MILRISERRSPGRATGVSLLEAFAVAALATGCAAPGPGSAGADERPLPTVAVISSDTWNFEWGTRDVAEEDLSVCLADQLSAARSDLRVVLESEFLAAAFPDLPPEAAPRSPTYIRMALTHPAVRERVAASRVDYVLYVAGTREMAKSWKDTEFVCYGGYAGASCSAWVTFEQTSQLTATMIDVRSTAEVNLVNARSSRTAWLVMPIAPLFLFHAPDTRAEACRELARKIVAELQSADFRQAGR